MSRSFVILLVVIAVLVAIGGAAGYWVREMDRDAPLGTKADSTTADALPLKPQAVGDTIYVSVRELGEQPTRAVPFALRELVRQGILLTVRDELGLATRDTLLREDFPEIPDKKSAPFEMTIVPSGDVRRTVIDYAITRGPKDERIWRAMINVDLNQPQSIATVAAKAETWSRTDFKEVLTQVGAKGSVPAARASSEVPAEVVDLLWSWNEISVLGGLRRIHGEIHEKGESPQLLAALIVGYANLGSLTEFYYSAANKAYHARAMLYAERLMHESDGSPWALWHRAYARTLFGAHSLAAEDISAAKKKSGDAATTLPFWTGVLDAFSQGQLAEMPKLSKTPPERRLARFLNLQAVMFGPLNDVRVKAAQAFLEECPDCPLGYDLIASFSKAGTAREQANSGFAATGKFLRKRLPDVPGLPTDLTQQLKNSETSQDMPADIEFRKLAIAALKQAGTTDRTEPSLSAVAHSIEEINFAQLMRKLTIEHNELGLSVESTVDTLGPLVADHPDGGYLTSFTQDQKKIKAGAAAAVRKFKNYELTGKDVPIVKWIGLLTKRPRVASFWQRPGAHVDLTLGDQMRYVESGLYGSAKNGVIPAENLERLWSTSDTLPVVIATRISRDWDHVKKEADKYERTYADDPLVMNALARRYYEMKHYDDAERCAKREIELAPSYAAYRLLASTYKAKQDDAHWKVTLDQAIKLSERGIEQAQLQNDVALALLEQNRVKEAVVYADAAAKSAPSGPLMTAVRCHELLDEWDQAEHLVKTASEHDDHARLNWMCWCHRTGHGDVHAADAFANERLTAWGKNLSPWQSRDFGLYFLILGDTANALPHLQQSYDASHEFYSGLHAAIAADSIGKTADRDALFKKIVDAPAKAGGEGGGTQFYGPLVSQLRHALPPDKAKQLDFGEVDRILASSKGTLNQSVLPYFVAIFLKNRGDVETAKKYLVRCAQANDWQGVEHALACQLLRQMKVKVPPTDAAPKTPAPVKAAAAPRPKTS
jgi:tetratricopeptide (TPR) repeat protein